MQYTVVVPYRGRPQQYERFLHETLPLFEERGYQTIIVEQANQRPFNLGWLLNVGVRLATTDLLIFHPLDYVPSRECKYELESGCDILFLNDSKYQPFAYKGLAFRRSAFEKVDGFNGAYEGWGSEDDDFRHFMHHAGFTQITRNLDWTPMEDYRLSVPSRNNRKLFNHFCDGGNRSEFGYAELRYSVRYFRFLSTLTRHVGVTYDDTMLSKLDALYRWVCDESILNIRNYRIINATTQDDITVVYNAQSPSDAYERYVAGTKLYAEHRLDALPLSSVTIQEMV